LIDNPPTAATVNGTDYAINTDYRTVLSYLRLLDDEDLSDQDKTALALVLFFGRKIKSADVEGLVTYVRWYINCGQEPEKNEKPKERYFDILIDSGRIFAAFFQTYDINLRETSIHWWTFCELLAGLPKGTHLADVIDIRARPFRPDMKPGERNELADLKRHYALDEKKDDVIGNLFDSLAGGCG
jgi:hypothetical protein